MSGEIEQKDLFKHLEIGKGSSIIVLYGLMGGLSNFEGVLDYFPKKGYQKLL